MKVGYPLPLLRREREGGGGGWAALLRSDCVVVCPQTFSYFCELFFVERGSEVSVRAKRK